MNLESRIEEPVFIGDGTLPEDPEERIRLRDNTKDSNKLLDQRIIEPFKEKIRRDNKHEYVAEGVRITVSEQTKEERLEPSKQYDRFRGYLSDKYGDKINGDRIPGIITINGEFFVSTDLLLRRLDWYQKITEETTTRTARHGHVDSTWRQAEPSLEKHIDQFNDQSTFPEISLDGPITTEDIELYFTAQYIKTKTKKSYIDAQKEKRPRAHTTQAKTKPHKTVREATRVIPDATKPYRQVLADVRDALRSRDADLPYRRRGSTHYVRLMSVLAFMYRGLEQVQYRQRVESQIHLQPQQFISFKLPSASSN